MKPLRPYQQKAVKETWGLLKANDDPVLLMASVGAGKSLMIASILLSIQKAGKRALCLVNNAELVRNNCATFIEEGGSASIYCAALDCKDASASVVFGTPQSVLNGINKNEAIGEIKFNLIVVDEAHAINYLNFRSCFMRILRHYKQEYPAMRLLGATGTNFRFKGAAIVGEQCLFRHQSGNITTEQLISDGYLIEPKFSVEPDLVLDFSNVKIKKNGLFDQKELEGVVEQSARLTELICKQIIHIMESQNRFGIFLFATTKKHACEILSHLPQHESALILGDTPQDERTRILEGARRGEIKYLVNIAIISVGVDVPPFDTLAYLRPTESLVLLVQTMGRVLRLSEKTAKSEALILDFAGNIERHKDWDNPILLKALQETIDKNKPLVISCPACETMNTESARRCIGKMDDKRCNYFFEFKACPSCMIKNDIASRHCRECKEELIDPNERLTLASINSKIIEVDVVKAIYEIKGNDNDFMIYCAYLATHKGTNFQLFESYRPINEKAKRVFYGQFIRKHCDKASQWYTTIHKKERMHQMLQTAKTPIRLCVMRNTYGLEIKKKIFIEDI